MKGTLRSVAVSFALVAAGLTALGQGASADPNASCNMGTPVSSGVSLSLDGVAQTQTASNVFGIYTLIVCRDANNSAYTTTIGRSNGSNVGSSSDLTLDDVNHKFTVNFSPQTGDIPLLAEGHGNMSSFAYDQATNLVTVSANPMPYSDIYGNDCNNQGPLACINAVTKASHDSVTLWYSIRFQDPSGKGSEYSYLPNMIWSSNAYMFWDRTSCPGQGSTDQSFSGIQFEIGGPHLKADGVTLNTAMATVFMPTDTVIKCWGAPPSVVATNLQITRAENGQTQTATTGQSADVGLQYTVTATADGLLITIPQVTFSVPKYTMGTKTKKTLARATKTFAQAAALVRLVKPVGGSVKITTTGSKTCTVAFGKVYAYKAGTCSFTATTYSKTGKKIKSLKGSFRVL